MEHVNQQNSRSSDIDALPEVTTFPCSLAQQRFWLLEKLDNRNPALNVSMRWMLEGKFSTESVDAAFRALIERYEILRTSFTEDDGVPVQYILQTAPFKLSVFDLTAMPEHERRQHADKIGEIDAHASFDIARPPLLRATLMRLNGQTAIIQMTLHHIVCDGWSVGILADEFGRLLEAYEKGERAVLPDLDLQYADYCLWQKDFLSSDSFTAESRYWREAMKDASYFEVAPDKPRPPVFTSNGAIRSISLPKKLTDDIEIFARKHECTLFHVASAALTVMLHRITGQHDIVIGTPVAGRENVELEKVVGPFINMLPLRFRVDSKAAFSDHLRDCKTSIHGALAHGSMPFERLTEMLSPERDLSRTPIFSTNFTLQRSYIKDKRYGNCRLTAIRSHSAGALWDLNFFMVGWGAGWRISCECNTDLFDQATVERMLAQWQMVLEDVISAPETPVGKINLISSADRETLKAWSGNEPDYPRDETLHGLFTKTASANLRRAAIADGTVTIDYADVEKRANRLAHYLSTSGVDRGARVALFCRRSPETVIAILAILKAGGAYVPLDPSYPARQLSHILDDSKPALMIGHSDLLQANSHQFGNSCPCITLEAALKASAGLSSEPPVGNSHATDLAYIMYTSGSTGTPKGVMVSHQAVIRLTQAQTFMRFGADETFLHLAPLAFDASTLEIWGTLLHGGKLAVVGEATPTLDRIVEVIHQQNVTSAWFTAGLFHALVDERVEDLRPLRQLLAGGDVLSPAHIRKAQGALPACQIINGYGPTENTTFTCCYPLPKTGLPEGPIPIGQPIANTKVFVCDADGELAPLGAVGELYAGGDGLALGYLNQPQLTADKFIVKSFFGEAQQRFYRTGDLVRWRKDGVLEFFGRVDNQLKLNGFRIELGEIEAALAKHASVGEVITVVRESAEKTKQIFAYVTPSSGCFDSLTELPSILVTHLAQLLPRHMIPAGIMILAALPKTPNGKIDRRALPKPKQHGTVLEDNVTRPPATDIEQRVGQIWSDILKKTAVDVGDNFFDLGGSSLSAVRMLARIKDAFGVKLELATLFRHPTLKAFAKTLAPTNLGENSNKISRYHLSSPLTPVIALNNTCIYRTLAAEIGNNRQFTDIAYFERQPSHSLDCAFEDFAADCVQLIRQAQPKGPYILLGLCVHGLLAFEAARQLRLAGESVPLVVMADTWCPTYTPSLPPLRRFAARIQSKAVQNKRHFAKLFTGKIGFVEFLSNYRLIKNSGLIDLAWRRRWIKERPFQRDEFEHQSFLDKMVLARMSYEVRPYSGDVLLLRSDEPMEGRLFDESFGWAPHILGELTLCRVPGMHADMFHGDGARMIAERLNKILGQIGIGKVAEKAT